MNCDELRKSLTEYAEGATDAELCAHIERHLAECGPCEELRLDLLQLSRLCRECDPPRLPEDTRRRIEKLLSGRE